MIRAAIAGPDSSATAARKLIDRGLFVPSVTQENLAAFIDHARSRIRESASPEGLPIDDVRREGQLPSLHLLTPMISLGGDRARLGISSLERSTVMLNGVMSTLREGSSKLGLNPLIREAYESFQTDYSRMSSTLERMQGSIKPRQAPLGAMDIDRSRGGWLHAMAQLASYRKQLRDTPLPRMMQHTEQPWVKPGKTAKPMFHTFTQIGLDGHPSNVFVRNTKDVDGRGATRVMSFVRPGSNGTLQVFRPTDRQIQGATDAHNRVGAGNVLRTQLEEMQADLARMKETRTDLQRQKSEAESPEGLLKPGAAKKAEGLTLGISKVGEKIARAEAEVLDMQKRVDRHEAEKAELMGSALMLDLSYDELHTNLQAMCGQLKMSEPELASAMLHLLGADNSSAGAAAAAKLNQEFTLPSAKVKYLFDEGDFSSKPVRMNGRDLCMSLMSIMFLTEPKHALPMALANLDALKAIQTGHLSLEALFSPMNVDFDGSQVMLTKSGDQRAIGSLLASGNTFQSVLDPSTPGTRALKEQVMSTTEQLPREVSPEDLPNLLSRRIEPQLQRASDRSRSTGIGGSSNSSMRSTSGLDPSALDPSASSIRHTPVSTTPTKSRGGSSSRGRAPSSSGRLDLGPSPSSSRGKQRAPSSSRGKARDPSSVQPTPVSVSSSSSHKASLWSPEASAKAQKFGGDSEIQQARQAAFLFPFAKAITLRAMLLDQEGPKGASASHSPFVGSSTASDAHPALSPQERTIAAYVHNHGKLSIAQVKNLMLMKPLGSLSIVAGSRQRQQIADWINQNQWIKPYLSLEHTREQLGRYGVNLS